MTLVCDGDVVPWMGKWAFDGDRTSRIIADLFAGKAVRIFDALSTVAAEVLHEELMEAKTWHLETHGTNVAAGIQHRRHLIWELSSDHGQPFNAAFKLFMDHDLPFWSSICLTNVDTFAHTATWYRAGDFISPHSDLYATREESRALTFILSLTKGWRPEYGGALWWFDGEPASITPAFNSLVLFVPSPRSWHMVSPVTGGGEDVHAHHRQPHAPYRRLAISGWFVKRNEDMLQERIEQMLPRRQSGVFVLPRDVPAGGG